MGVILLSFHLPSYPLKPGIMPSQSASIEVPPITFSPEEKKALLENLDTKGGVGYCFPLIHFARRESPPYSEK